MSENKIEIILDTHEVKSLPVLKNSGLFSIVIAPLAVGDLLIKLSEAIYLIELKIGNDLKDLSRCKQEITNMSLAAENDRVRPHLIFIEEGYTADNLEYPWIVNSECHRAGVYFHRRKLLEHLPVLIKKIAAGEYTKTRLHLKEPPKILTTQDKTHRALPFIARVLALVDGITVETALDLYDEIRKRSEKEPGVHDMFREIVLNCMDEFPSWLDFKIGGWEEKSKKIDTDRKKENFNKLSVNEKIEKYRAAIVSKLISTLSADNPIIEKKEEKNDGKIRGVSNVSEAI